MREFSKVGIGFWDSELVAQLDDKGKLLALYLSTCKHGNSAGMFMLREGYVTADLGWDSLTVREQFANLSRVGYAAWCDRTSWVVIHKALKHNRFENSKSAAATAKLVKSIPGAAEIWSAVVVAIGSYWPDAYEEIGKSLSAHAEGILRRSATVREQLANEQRTAREKSGRETETETETETESTSDDRLSENRDAYPVDFEAMWQTYPKRMGANPKHRAVRAWRARIKDGSTATAIAEGVQRYAQWVRAQGKEHTEYVMQTATFIGPDQHFAEPWAVSAAPNKQEALERRNHEALKDWHPPEDIDAAH